MFSTKQLVHFLFTARPQFNKSRVKSNNNHNATELTLTPSLPKKRTLSHSQAHQAWLLLTFVQWSWESSSLQHFLVSKLLNVYSFLVKVGISHTCKMRCLKEMLSNEGPTQIYILFLSSWVYKWRLQGPTNINKFFYFPKPLSTCICCRKAQENLCSATLRDVHSDSLKNNSKYNGVLLPIKKKPLQVYI